MGQGKSKVQQVVEALKTKHERPKYQFDDLQPAPNANSPEPLSGAGESITRRMSRVYPGPVALSEVDDPIHSQLDVAARLYAKLVAAANDDEKRSSVIAEIEKNDLMGAPYYQIWKSFENRTGKWISPEERKAIVLKMKEAGK